MELDTDIKQSLIEASRNYLKEKHIPYRFITIRRGIPVVIVSEDVFYQEIINRNLEGDTVKGHFLTQGEKGWSAYKRTDEESRFQLKENLTEYQASCWITDTEYGRKPKLSRYAMGGAIS